MVLLSREKNDQKEMSMQIQNFAKFVIMIYSLWWAVTTGPSTGLDVIAPGRQDVFLGNHNPVFRSADISVAPPYLHPV